MKEGVLNDNDDLEKSNESRKTIQEDQVDGVLESKKDADESSHSSSPNILTIILSKFIEVREEEEALEDDFCPICMEEYGENTTIICFTIIISS